MNEELILENWPRDDDKEIRDARDGKNVSCTETWEMDYLKDAIKGNFSKYSEKEIVAAIQSCCQSIAAPRPRKKFVQCVLNKLAIGAILKS